MEDLLEDDVAIVTGGSRGIGRDIVLKFSDEGARVAFNYHSDDESANEVKEELEERGRDYLLFKGSVTDSDFVDSMIQDVKDEWGSVDCLVNNAGITKDGPLMMMSEDDWDQVLETNLKGPFYFTKKVISTMMAQERGSIVNIASLSGIFGREFQANYGASKAGLIGFTRCLARELGPDIRVNSIAGGFIDTQMTKELDRDTRKKMIDLIPMGRAGEPQEVAKAALFLASEMSSYMTGATLNVTGGQYM